MPVHVIQNRYFCSRPLVSDSSVYGSDNLLRPRVDPSVKAQYPIEKFNGVIRNYKSCTGSSQETGEEAPCIFPFIYHGQVMRIVNFGVRGSWTWQLSKPTSWPILLTKFQRRIWLNAGIDQLNLSHFQFKILWLVNTSVVSNFTLKFLHKIGSWIRSNTDINHNVGINWQKWYHTAIIRGGAKCCNKLIAVCWDFWPGQQIFDHIEDVTRKIH